MFSQSEMWRNLQLFAEDAAEDMGAESLPADAQQDSAGEAGEGYPEADTEASAAENQAATEPFRVFKTQEEFQGYFDKTIGERLKDSREAREKLGKYEPVIDSLKKAWGVEDLDGLLAKAEEQAISELAYAKGVDPSVAKDIYQAQREAAQVKSQLYAIQAAQAEAQQADLTKQLFTALDGEFAALKASDPALYGDANVSSLLENQQFISMLSAGVPIKAAYDALHVDKIKIAALTQAQQKVVANIQARAARPPEGAMTSGEGATTKLDPAKLTAAERDDINRRVARGEIITFL